MITVRALTGGDYLDLKELRIRSFTSTAPHFEQTLGMLRERSDETWHEIVAAYLTQAQNVTLLACEVDAACGMVMCRHPASEPEAGEVEVLWVNLEARRRRVATRLVATAKEWFATRGAQHAIALGPRG